MAAPVSELIHDIAALTPTAPKPTIRAVAVRAKRLGRCDLLPAWLSSASLAAPAAPAAPAPSPSPVSEFTISENALQMLDAKSRVHRVPVSALREVFYREMVSKEPLPPGVKRASCAHARVNSFIRLAQGDPDARNDDSDLLSLLD